MSGGVGAPGRARTRCSAPPRSPARDSLPRSISFPFPSLRPFSCPDPSTPLSASISDVTRPSRAVQPFPDFCRGVPVERHSPSPMNQTQKKGVPFSTPFSAIQLSSQMAQTVTGICLVSATSRRRRASMVSLKVQRGCFCVPWFTTAPRSSSAVMVELDCVLAVDSETV